jgi:hypothetical protein
VTNTWVSRWEATSGHALLTRSGTRSRSPFNHHHTYHAGECRKHCSGFVHSTIFFLCKSQFPRPPGLFQVSYYLTLVINVILIRLATLSELNMFRGMDTSFIRFRPPFHIFNSNTT